jgi:hypothetical protein
MKKLLLAFMLCASGPLLMAQSGSNVGIQVTLGANGLHAGAPGGLTYDGLVMLQNNTSAPVTYTITIDFVTTNGVVLSTEMTCTETVAAGVTEALTLPGALWSNALSDLVAGDIEIGVMTTVTASAGSINGPQANPMGTGASLGQSMSGTVPASGGTPSNLDITSGEGDWWGE